MPKGIKGTRKQVIVTHNPSEIDQAQLLEVKFPSLGSDDIIVPRTVNLSFNIELTFTADPKRTIKFKGNEIMSIDDFGILKCYRDLWKTTSEKKNAIRQGIISTDGWTINCMGLRINTGVAQDKAIEDAYGNKFIIPLHF